MTSPRELRGIADERGLKRALLDARRGPAGRERRLRPRLGAECRALLAQREVRATLDGARGGGLEARYLAVDVQDAAALSAALDGVRQASGARSPRVVHGAGVLADKRIAEKTDEQFDRVFDTKVSGLRALLAATASDPLEAICLFSSVAARTGNLGQCDYAMANEVLNLVACAERARRGAACVVRSIGWGPWEGGMVTPSLKAHFAAAGRGAHPARRGAACSSTSCTARSDEVDVVVGGSHGEARSARRRRPRPTVEVRVDAASHPYLGDHAIAGTPVVPVVMAVEWFLRAARACRPDLRARGGQRRQGAARHQARRLRPERRPLRGELPSRSTQRLGARRSASSCAARATCCTTARRSR